MAETPWRSKALISLRWIKTKPSSQESAWPSASAACKARSRSSTTGRKPPRIASLAARTSWSARSSARRRALANSAAARRYSVLGLVARLDGLFVFLHQLNHGVIGCGLLVERLHQLLPTDPISSSPGRESSGNSPAASSGSWSNGTF
jgi:hypothetical protein